MEYSYINCNNIVNKYQQILLSDEKTTEVNNNIFQYYTMMAKKSNVCLFCKKPKSKNIFSTTYAQDTACKTLYIKCTHSPPCPGWSYTYGVMFNVYKQVKTIKKHIEDMKTNIIFNKNNVLYGYISLSDAKKLHDKLLFEIEEQTKVYTVYLYNLLFYTDNVQFTNDITNIKTRIKLKIIEIKPLIEQDNFKEVVKIYKEIIQLYECIRKLNKFVESVTTQQLIHCKDSTTKSTPSDLLPTGKKASSTKKSKTPTKTPTKTKKNKNNHITDLLDSVKDLLENDNIYELVKSNPSSKEDLDTYMSILKEDIQNGTAKQQKEYAKFEKLYNTFTSSKSTKPVLNDVEIIPDDIDDILESVKDLLENDKIYELVKSNPSSKEDLDTYMSILKDDIQNGTSKQKQEYAKFEKLYNTFLYETTKPVIPNVETLPDDIDDMLDSVKDLLENDKIYELVKSNPSSKEDLDTYMSILKDDIQNGTLKQKQEYAKFEKLYNTFTSSKSTKPVLNDVEIIPDDIDDILESVKEILSSDTLYNESKDDLETFMNILKQDIQKGTPKQQQEYNSYVEKYKKIKTFKKPTKIPTLTDAIEL